MGSSSNLHNRGEASTPLRRGPSHLAYTRAWVRLSRVKRISLTPARLRRFNPQAPHDKLRNLLDALRTPIGTESTP